MATASVYGQTKGCCAQTSFEETTCNLCDDGSGFSYKRRKDGSSDILAMTAKELNAMSVQDREKLFEEVNGIPTTIREEPDFVNECLARLQEEIGRVKLDRSAYDLAFQMRPQLLKDRTFLLMFLRADCFDVGKAARRVIKHFDAKRLLFGESKLVKSITFDDLDGDDQETLLRGAWEVLRYKDQAGRRILFNLPKRTIFKGWKNEVRGWKF